MKAPASIPFSFCAIIPAYNESRRIADVIRQARNYCAHVIVIDDGSSDGTAEAARTAGAEVVRFESNRGKGVALQTGLRLALERNFDAAFTLDADGQHLPEEMPRFIEMMRRTGADIVLGTRLRKPAGMPIVRLITNRIQSVLITVLAGPLMSDSQTGYRLIRPRVVKGVKYFSNRYAFESEILVRAARRGFRIVEAEISCAYGGEKSGIRPLRDTLRFFRMLLQIYR